MYEPKLLVLLFAAAVLSGALIGRTVRGAASQIAPFAKGLLILLIAQVVGLSLTPNLGSGLMAVGLTASWFLVFVYVSQCGLSAERFYLAALVLASICLLSTVPDIVFGVSLLSPFGPRCGLIGTKNALVVFLAQLIPLVLLFLVANRDPSKFRLSGALLGNGVLTLSIYVVFVSRVRSAWIVLIVYVVGLVVAQCRKGSNESWFVLRDLLGAVVCAWIFACCIPTTLHWRDSASPYLTSISSLFSLDASHGRDLLWRVAVEMIKSDPWLGIGTGSYASQWPQFISQSGVFPGVFAFLRQDLPLFNDYLQMAVENGVLAVALFTFLFLLFPIVALIRQLFSKNTLAVSLYVMTLMCVATSVDAMVDYPFHRVETSLFFVTGMGFVARELWPRPAPAQGSLLRGVYVMCGLFSLGLALVMASAFWLRTAGVRGGVVSPLRRSIALWPFDPYFSSGNVSSLISKDEPDVAERLVLARRAYWPSDPEGFLMLATLLEQQGDKVGAEAAYSRARFFVEGGRCYWPGVTGYRAFRVRHSLDNDPSDPREDEALCRARRIDG